MVQPSNARCLGCSIRSVPSISASFEERIKELAVMGERLKHLLTQDSRLLLRHSLAIPRVLYNLRSSPCFLSPKLQVYDILLKSITSKITNISFGEDDPAWIQATLLVRCGGLGIRSAVKLAPSAFLASAAACSDLIHQIVSSYLQNSPILHWSDALAKWSFRHDLSLPHGTSQQ